MRAFLVLLVILTEGKLQPTNQEQNSKTLRVIQDILSKTLQKNTMNAVQIFTKGDSMDSSVIIDHSNMNHTYLIGLESPITDEHGNIMTLLFVNDSMSLKSLTSSLYGALHKIRRYFIVTLSNCGYAQSLTTIKDIFEELWKLQISNVILVCPKLETTELYTFYPYSKDHCNKVEPVLVMSKENYFPPKNLNFHGCSLRAAIYMEAPHFIGSPTKGIDAELLTFLTKSLNFKIFPEFFNQSQAIEIHDPKSGFFKKVPS